ncbi:transposase [Xenorhabdus sp. PB30.3]|nr:transposase [Xenorhabdus sp. PB30.3]
MEIEPLLLSNRKRTRPRKVDVYEIFCALLYLLKSGCQWDMLPSDFPSKSTVYYYFKLWKEKPSETEPSLLEQVLKKWGWRGPYPGKFIRQCTSYYVGVLSFKLLLDPVRQFS